MVRDITIDFEIVHPCTNVASRGPGHERSMGDGHVSAAVVALVELPDARRASRGVSDPQCIGAQSE